MPDRGALPKYMHMSELLLREIAAGRLRVGDRLPPEREMAQGMGVAVGTLRKALARLTDLGVIDRRQGSGNYIATSGQGSGLYSFFRLERIDGGGLPRAQVLSVLSVPKPDGAPDFGRAHMAQRIRRLRSLDHVTVAAEEIWLDAGRVPELHAADLSESLYLYYRKRLGIWITGVEDRIGLGHVPGWGAQIGLACGAPCARVDRISTALEGDPVEYSQTWFNPDRARYVARIS